MILLSVFCLICAVTISEGYVYRSDYKYSEAVGGWLKYHSIPSNWHEARMRCQYEGALLASPINGELTAALVACMKEETTSPIYTGIHATYSRGDFFSMEGIPLADIIKRGVQNEFDNKNDDEKCVVMFSSGSLADVNCQLVYPYVCYKKYDPLLPQQNECGTTDSEYSYSAVTGHCYKFHRIGKLWHRAFMHCAAEGAYLAIINSAKEAMVLGDLFARYPQDVMLAGEKNIAHIGFRSEDNSNDWITVHGETLSEAGYDVFSGGQPDNGSVEACGGMFRNSRLDDIWCWKHAPFICEKSPTTLQVNF